MEINESGGKVEVRRDSVVKVHKGETKRRENLDEILTERTEEVDSEPVVEHRNVAVETTKEKGFSLQRAWCCLRRRTS